MLAIFLSQSLYSIFVGGDIGELFPSANRFLSVVMPIFMILLALSFLVIFNLTKKIPFLYRMKNSRNTLIQTTKYTVSALFFVYLTLVMSHTPLSSWLPFDSNELTNPNSLPYHTASGLYFKCISSPKASIAVVWAGATPYFAQRTAIDLLGKNDVIIAHEPMLTPSPNDPNRFTFFGPGHLKWDYAYSIGKLKPDIVEELYGNIASAFPYLDSNYTYTNGYYLKNHDKNIYYNKLGECLKYFRST